jgi:hypothetical protein
MCRTVIQPLPAIVSNGGIGDDDGLTVRQDHE